MESKLEAVLRLARKKMGEPDAAALKTVQSVKDDDRLDRMIDAILAGTSWTDLMNMARPLRTHTMPE